MTVIASRITDQSSVCSDWQFAQADTKGPRFCPFPPVTGDFPAQRDSNAENVSIWWRHNVEIKREVVIFSVSIITIIGLSLSGSEVPVSKIDLTHLC